MEVLVINCGSSSLKFQLIDSDSEKVLAIFPTMDIIRIVVSTQSK